MDTGVYVIVNAVNGHRYVGSAVSFRKRWKEHVRQLADHKHHSRYLQRAWNKHGPESFHFRPIVYCARENLLVYEQAAMDALSPEYNIAPVAGSQLGYRHSEETRAKLRAARARNGFSPMKGRTHSEESKRKCSENRKGKGGGPRAPERLAKISAALKGRVVPQEMRSRISATLTGRKQSRETIEKRASKLRGRKMPNGFAEAASARMRGRTLAPETIEKLRRSKSKLSDDQVRSIRYSLANGEKQKVIAERFGVDQSVISTISTRTSYQWVG